MIDPRIDVDPDECCAFCGEPFLDENKLVFIESGYMRPSKRDERFLVFVPDRDTRQEETQPIIGLFHLHCVQTGFGLDISWLESKHCGLCPREFRAYERVFHLQKGKIDEDTLVFVPLDQEKSATLLCTYCTYDGFGEGDVEEGRSLLEAVS